MEKAWTIIIVLILGVVLFRSCSEQSLTRNWGGEMEISLEPNEKLVEVTWKDDNLWILTKEMTEEDIEESYKFFEKDALGVLEGTVYIKENKLSEEEFKFYEEQKLLEKDYYKEGNIVYDEDTYENKEVFIQYNIETDTYTKLEPYTYDENGFLISNE